jgi:hypothetical protein
MVLRLGAVLFALCTFLFLAACLESGAPNLHGVEPANVQKDALTLTGSCSHRLGVTDPTDSHTGFVTGMHT